MKPVLTKEGKETVKDFIANLEALQKEVLDAGKDRRGDAEIPTEEDILQDILFFEDEIEHYQGFGEGIRDMKFVGYINK